ncbi:MAG: HAMP domain-containing protein, partial [Aquificaceae bacterium]
MKKLLPKSIRWKISLPMEELQRKAEEIAKGNVDEPIEVKSDDEIGKLAESFERMRVSIKKV